MREDASMKTAEQMAQELVRSQTDPNEVAKVAGYLRSHSGQEFFALLNAMVTDGQQLVRSGRTLDYYREIRRVCDKYLRPYRDRPNKMAQILGWAVRLMRYYQVRPAPAQPAKAPPTTRPAPGARPRRIEDLQPGMVLPGTVRRVLVYGAFVDIGVGRDGLVHISELAEGYVANVTDVVNEGDQVIVQVLSVDLRKKRISLSMKGVPQE